MATECATKELFFLPLATVNEIDRLLIQASAITVLIGEGAAGNASSDQIQNACWAVAEMLEKAKDLANLRRDENVAGAIL